MLHYINAINNQGIENERIYLNALIHSIEIDTKINANVLLIFCINLNNTILLANYYNLQKIVIFKYKQRNRI